MADGPNPSSRGGGHNSNPRDWLKDLDSRVNALTPARSWLEYPYFMFVRYPALQPRVNDRDFQLSDLMRRTIEKKLDDQLAKIATHPHGISILQDLKVDQCRQLAALVIDCVTDFKQHYQGAEHGKRLTRLTKQAQRRQRVLDKKVNQLRKEIENLRAYAEKLDDWLGAGHRTFAQVTLEALDRLEHYQTEQEWKRDGRLHDQFAEIADWTPFPDDPTSSSMVQLYWFFRSECSFSGNASEIRTALVRNVCFSPWNKPVRVVLNHRTPEAESRGATAVAQAVRRFRPQDPGHCKKS